MMIMALIVCSNVHSILIEWCDIMIGRLRNLQQSFSCIRFWPSTTSYAIQYDSYITLLITTDQLEHVFYSNNSTKWAKELRSINIKQIEKKTKKRSSWNRTLVFSFCRNHTLWEESDRLYQIQIDSVIQLKSYQFLDWQK